MTIHLLDPLLANQIAAGEVVERPLSIVKELIENSLDAHATHIEVDIEAGGKKQIKVSDNGMGIPQSDLLLAISRHATSKIENLTDLEQLRSLGFRGEALASISAVTRFSLRSKTKEAEHAWQIEVEGNEKTVALSPTAHPLGTTVEANDLFFNTPVRRKFLKGDAIEFEHIEEVIKRLALSRFDVGFALRHNGRQIYQFKVADTPDEKASRVTKLFGQPFLQQSFFIQVEQMGMSLYGWLGWPEMTRSDSNFEYTYINGRMVRDKTLMHAFRSAYSDLIYPGRFPLFILYFDLNPEWVDVNVHPTKHEVRFRQGRHVHDFLYRSVRDALHQKSMDQQKNSIDEKKISKPAELISSRGRSYSFPFPPLKIAEPSFHFAPNAPSDQHFRNDVKTVPLSADIEVKSAPFCVIGICHKRYLLLEQTEGLQIVDWQKALHRGILNRLHRAQPNGIKMQPLLLPVSIHLPEKRANRIEEDALFKEMGLDVERKSAETILVRQIPAILRGIDVEKLLIAILNALEKKEASFEKQWESIFQSMAHAYVDSEMKHSLIEQEFLLNELHQAHQLSDVSFVWTHSYLEEMFKKK